MSLSSSYGEITMEVFAFRKFAQLYTQYAWQSRIIKNQHLKVMFKTIKLVCDIRGC